MYFPDYHLKVYVRLSGFRRVDEIPRDLLEVATMEVDGEHRRQGHGTRFLAYAEKAALTAGLSGVFVENVDALLQGSLRENGYKPLFGKTGSMVFERNPGCLVKIFG